MDTIGKFKNWLLSEERSSGTVEKYVRDIVKLMNWLGGRELTKETLAEWKETLVVESYAPITVNSMLAAANTYCRFMGHSFRARLLRIQKRLFREEDKELKKDEYEHLIKTAEQKGKHRLALLMETIGSTGIRVSEVQYITMEAARAGRAKISLKGKIRVIMLPGKLCKKLLRYAKQHKIASGEIFITKGGRAVTRKQLWAEMKAICKAAGVAASKVFPHNLRHLFARVYYRVTRDVAKLADLLGHSSIETTRIYLLSTGEEHAQQLEILGLVQ